MKNKLINHKCYYCNVMEGQFHKHNCEMEICPFCESQLISCTCVYKKLGVPLDSEGKHLIEIQWKDILDKKGRIPYIQYPIICAKCGGLWPDLFMTNDKEWKYYIQPDMREKVICKPCYNWIKKQIDKYNKCYKEKL